MLDDKQVHEYHEYRDKDQTPPVAPRNPNIDIVLFNTNLTPLTENAFVQRVKAYADSGNHVLIIDEAIHFTVFNGYNNITYVPVILDAENPHEIISDIPLYASKTYQWLNNGYI